MLKRLACWWNDYLGNHELEQAIRDQLRRDGFRPHALKLRDVKLVAIERPGWVQIWQFRAETKTVGGQHVILHGAACDDGRRSGSEVHLSDSLEEIESQIDAWSIGFIRR